ncbi:hypothetical protein BZA05DRAFT_449503 [Tricharina praecox]|uniref:uncharacterized protein n=1 Tax=Tricharina praecox TaxID=43433 RepID=UPI00221E6032|nr:uncharacterized protein BZA05DRAFT_449503 [Tricharina praecox]KAI5841622.1 hypothetical protein BZA05DRAFT_449503 [Tricharina praecox]
MVYHRVRTTLDPNIAVAEPAPAQTAGLQKLTSIIWQHGDPVTVKGIRIKMKDHEGGFILENDFPLSPVTTGASDDNNISKWAARRIAKLEEQILAIHYHIATIRIDFEINSLKINGLPLNTIRAWVGNDAGPEILARYGFHAGSKGVSHPSGMVVSVTLQLHLVTLNLEEFTGISSPNEYLTFVWLLTIRRPFYWINNLANRDHEGGFIREDDFPLSPVITGASDDIQISKIEILRPPPHGKCSTQPGCDRFAGSRRTQGSRPVGHKGNRHERAPLGGNRHERAPLGVRIEILRPPQPWQAFETTTTIMPVTRSHPLQEMAPVGSGNPAASGNHPCYRFRPNLVTVQLKYIAGIPSHNEYLTRAWLPTSADHSNIRDQTKTVAVTFSLGPRGRLYSGGRLPSQPVTTGASDDIKISKIEILRPPPHGKCSAKHGCGRFAGRTRTQCSRPVGHKGNRHEWAPLGVRIEILRPLCREDEDLGLAPRWSQGEPPRAGPIGRED